MRYIAKKGISDYSVLISSHACEKVRYASLELKKFLLEATGFEAEIVVERPENPVIELIAENKYDDGFEVTTVGENIVVRGNSERGVVYGVYALCNALFGLEFFTPEYYSIKKGDLPFRQLNITVKPDIPARSLGIAPVYDYIAGERLLPNALRMGLMGMAEDWGICSHSYFKILPPAKYKDSHPDWYSAGDDGKNLCLSNEEMRREFTENLYRIVLDSPKMKYYMIGQEDSTTYCNCPECTRAIKELNGSFSSMVIQFTNDVIREINARLKKDAPERKVVFIMFAYQQTLNPPVKKVGDGFESLYRGDIEENFAVMLAPLNAQSDFSYFDEKNHTSFGKTFYNADGKATRDILLGWRAITSKIFFWSYHVDNTDWFIPFDDWDVISENYRAYVKMGVHYLFEEGSYGKYIPNFNKLRVYVYSRMMWNVNLDPQELINRFMEGYYGSIHVKVRRYFDFLREHCLEISKKQGRPMLYVTYDDFDLMSAAKYWPKDVLEKALELYNDALSSATPEEYERFKEEGAPVMYMLLLDYADSLYAERRIQYASFITDIATRYNYFENCEAVLIPNFNRIKQMAAI